MAKRNPDRAKKPGKASEPQNGGIVELTRQLFQAAITLRGAVEPADYGVGQPVGTEGQSSRPAGRVVVVPAVVAPHHRSAPHPVTRVSEPSANRRRQQAILKRDGPSLRRDGARTHGRGRQGREEDARRQRRCQRGPDEYEPANHRAPLGAATGVTSASRLPDVPSMWKTSRRSRDTGLWSSLLGITSRI